MDNKQVLSMDNKDEPCARHRPEILGFVTAKAA